MPEPPTYGLLLTRGEPFDFRTREAIQAAIASSIWAFAVEEGAVVAA